MNQKHKDLIAELEALDLQGVKFRQAKDQSLSKGYTESDIDHAI